MKIKINKKKRKLITLIIFIIFCSVLFVGQSPKFFSEENHIERISKLVNKRYINESDKYTGYKVYPLYNEADELAYFLIELEPFGFVYVKINITYLFLRIFGGASMYTRAGEQTWRRYRIRREGSLPLPEDRLWKVEMDQMGYSQYPNRRWEVNEAHEFINYNVSHFKAANIENEKRYLLRIEQSSSSGYIPAVKRGDKYLNLVSMEEMKYELAMASQAVSADEYPYVSLLFVPKKDCDL
jgi:hypothetical protein